MFSHLLNYYFFNYQNSSEFSYSDILQIFEGSLQKDYIDLYIHIPFCARICSYCKLKKKKLESLHEIVSYIDLLEEQLQEIYHIHGKINISSLWFGGGTPSILGEEDIIKIGKLLHKYLNIHTDSVHFFECHSDNLDENKIQALVDMGIGGIVLPVQSSNKKVLSEYNRGGKQYFTQLEKVFILAKKYGLFVSTDMIFGLNGSNLIDEIKTFRYAESLGFDEIVVYMLQNNDEINSTEDLMHIKSMNGNILQFLEFTQRSSYSLQGNISPRSTYYFGKNGKSKMIRYSPCISRRTSILTLGKGVFGNIFGRYRFSSPDIDSPDSAKFFLKEITLEHEMLEYFFWRMDTQGCMNLSEFYNIFSLRFESIFSEYIDYLLQKDILALSGENIFLIGINIFKNIHEFQNIFSKKL